MMAGPKCGAKSLQQHKTVFRHHININTTLPHCTALHSHIASTSTQNGIALQISTDAQLQIHSDAAAKAQCTTCDWQKLN